MLRTFLTFYNPRTEEEMRDARCSFSSSLPSASGEAARAAPLFFLDASTGRMVLRRPTTEAPAPTTVEARAPVVDAAERASGESAPAAARSSPTGPDLLLGTEGGPSLSSALVDLPVSLCNTEAAAPSMSVGSAPATTVAVEAVVAAPPTPLVAKTVVAATPVSMATTMMLAASPAPSCAEASDASGTAVSVVSSSPEFVEVRGACSLGFETRLALILARERVRYHEISTHAPRTLKGVLHVASSDQLFGLASQAVLNGVLDVLARPIVACTATVGQRAAPEVAPSVLQVPPAPPQHLTSQAREAAERRRQCDWLLSSLPAYVEWHMLRFREVEWARVPMARKEQLRYAHLTSFSAGSLAGCRRALSRLSDWLERNDLSGPCSGYCVSAGLLAWFVTDMQEASRSSGVSVPNSLRGGLTFARDHLSLEGLEVRADSFRNIAAPSGKMPEPALSATVSFLYHFYVNVSHASAVVSYYSSGLMLCLLACLRVRDAQRAVVRCSSSMVSGICYTSKHPKRRQAKQMPFFVPAGLPFATGGKAWSASLQHRGEARDYVFPRLKIPRGRPMDDVRVSFLPGAASSSAVIKAMRFLLTLPPLRLSVEDAKKFSGHSLRHMLPTLARAMALPVEDREELGRWAARLEARARDQHMPNLYASEAAPQRVVQIVQRLLRSAHVKVQAEGGADSLFRQSPLEGGAWSLFGPGDLSPLVGAEASSSESGSDSEDTVVV